MSKRWWNVVNTSLSWMSMVFSFITISYCFHWDVNWQSLNQSYEIMLYLSVFFLIYRERWQLRPISNAMIKVVELMNFVAKLCNSIHLSVNSSTPLSWIKVVLLCFGLYSPRLALSVCLSLEKWKSKLRNLLQDHKFGYLFLMKYADQSFLLLDVDLCSR